MTTPLSSLNSVSDRPQTNDLSQRVFAHLVGSTPRTRDLALVVLRVFFGLALALTHGRTKLNTPARFIEGLSKHGFPLPQVFGWAAILSEFLGGLLLAFGLLTRPAATFVLVTLGVAAFDFHSADPFAKRELALAYAVVALALAIAGPGRYSIDAWAASRAANKPAPDRTTSGKSVAES